MRRGNDQKKKPQRYNIVVKDCPWLYQYREKKFGEISKGNCVK
jgi:hypothetical protein